MKVLNADNYYLYNNEAIGLVAISSILKLNRKLSISKAMLILPLILHDPTMNYLQRKNVRIKSVDQLISDKFIYISNFNKRYISMLPVTLNCLYLLEKLQLIKIEESNVIIIGAIQLDEKKLGKRGKKVYKSADNVNNILKSSDYYLYLQLRVEL